MVSSITGSQSSNILAGLSPQQTTPSGSTASFTDQLAAALEGYLAQSGNSSNLEIDIQATQSQNSGVRQFIVTVKNPDSAPGQTAAAASTAAPASAPASSGQSSSAQPLPRQRSLHRASARPARRWTRPRRRTSHGRRSTPTGPHSRRQSSSCATSATSASDPWWRSSWPIKATPSTADHGVELGSDEDHGDAPDVRLHWVPSFNQASVSTPGMAVYRPDAVRPGAIRLPARSQ